MRCFFSCDAFDEDEEDGEISLADFNVNEDTCAFPSSVSEYDRQIFNLINWYRNAKGLSMLKFDSAIYSQCRGHSASMADGSTAFGHDGFSSRGERIKPWSWAGENVAMNNSTDPKYVVNQWLNSEGHKKNIEKSGATHSAVSAVQRSGGGWYYTQIFITR